jgi:hypothetical protein
MKMKYNQKLFYRFALCGEVLIENLTVDRCGNGQITTKGGGTIKYDATTDDLELSHCVMFLRAVVIGPTPSIRSGIKPGTTRIVSCTIRCTEELHKWLKAKEEGVK